MGTADVEAERALLGACLLSDDAIEASQPYVQPADFTTIRHRAIYDAILDAYGAGERSDPLTVARRVRGVDVDPEYLHELFAATYSVGLAVRYARLIAEARVKAKLVHAAGDIVALVKEDGPASDAAERARSLVADIDMPTELGAPDATIDEWVGAVDMTYDWLIPDFLEHGDRMLVTAGEGGGKSTLLAQIGVMAAAGIHPWNYAPTAPVNVAIIDLENGHRLVARRLGGLRSKVAADFDPRRCRVHARQAGIDLTTPTDRRWLLERCKANETQLLIIGPAYRLARSSGKHDMGGEEQARQVTEALDDIRARAGVTILMETHAPHAAASGNRDLRPYGSSLWLRWPEFGIGFAKSKDNPRLYRISHWRDPRDVRQWPQALERGGHWPWTPIGPSGAFSAPPTLTEEA